ncbi:MAG TPA: hypothetical protein DHW40_04915 [Microbacterium sp.]|nr:hypothetical protein [Microbacterium sp.]
MTDPAFSPLAEVQDPQTSAERLAQLATDHPGLRPWIASHPNSYPALREWIDATARAAATPPVTVTEPTDPFEGSSRTSTQKPRRRGLIIGLAVGLVAVLVIAGGGAWWFFASRLGGASSPEAAAAKLISGASQFDPLSLYGSLAPSEVSLLRGPLERVSNASGGSGDVATPDTQEILASLRSELTVATRDLEFESEELADGVARVTWTSGQITIDGEEEAVADAFLDAYEPFLRSSFESAYDEDYIDSAVADARESIASGLEFPHTIDARDSDTPIAVVTVDEGGWFVSPMLSYADAAYMASGSAGGSPDNRLGDEIVEAKIFDTPEEASFELIDAALSGDVEELAAALPLAERRLLSIYGGQIAQSAGYGTNWPTGLDLTVAEFSSVIDGDTARVDVDEMAWSMTSYDYSLETDLTDSYSLSGTCMEWVNRYSWDDGWWSSGWYGSDEWIENYVVKEDQGDACLGDQPVLGNLGLDEAAVIAVKENGGWLVSPTATLAEVTALATDRFLEYYQEGRLEDLVNP